MPAIPAFESVRQEDSNLKVILGYLVRLLKARQGFVEPLAYTKQKQVSRHRQAYSTQW